MANIKISELHLAEAENELIALMNDEQARVQGGLLPFLLGAAAAATTVYYGIQIGKEYVNSSVHKDKGHWWSFL